MPHVEFEDLEESDEDELPEEEDDVEEDEEPNEDDEMVDEEISKAMAEPAEQDEEWKWYTSFFDV